MSSLPYTAGYEKRQRYEPAFRIVANSLAALVFTSVLLVLPGTKAMFSGESNLRTILTTVLITNLLQETNRFIDIRVSQAFRFEQLKRMLFEWTLVPVSTSVFLFLLGYLMPYIPASAACTSFAIGLLFFSALHAARSMHRASFMSCIIADAEKRQKDQAMAQLNLMRSHFNPHFMFNCLNALSSLIHQDQNGASDFVDELSQVMRYVLANKDKEYVPLGGELDFLRSYMYLAKIRFREKIKFELDISPAVAKRRLPPLLLHMLAETALRENAVTAEQPMTISIRTEGSSIIISHPLYPKDNDEQPGLEAAERLRMRYAVISGPAPETEITDDHFKAAIPLLPEEGIV
ncbi:MAG: histidine kinase [Bacteroidota bacterium]